jgi:phage portal protein BeeE
MLHGIGKAMKASQAINGVVKYGTVLGRDQNAAAVAEFEDRIKSSESGILALDMSGEYMPITRDLKLVDADTLKFIDEKILRNWKVPLCILRGDYTKEQYEAFYQSALEPIIKATSQAFTKKLFTKREKAFGNRVELYPKDLIFMTMSQKIEMVSLLSPTGGMMENEKRATFGLVPLPELEGKRYMSLNWIDANNADQYQVGKNEKVNVDVVDESKEETNVDEEV